MSNPIVKFKRAAHCTLPLPQRAVAGSAGLDLQSNEPTFQLRPGERRLVKTGFHIELPAGYEGQIRPRSGNALNWGITVLNSPGTVDYGYTGEIGVLLYNAGAVPFDVEHKDRIAQLVIAPVSRVESVEVEELSSSERGSGGWGSTGG